MTLQTVGTYRFSRFELTPKQKSDYFPLSTSSTPPSVNFFVPRSFTSLNSIFLEQQLLSSLSPTNVSYGNVVVEGGSGTDEISIPGSDSFFDRRENVNDFRRFYINGEDGSDSIGQYYSAGLGVRQSVIKGGNGNDIISIQRLENSLIQGNGEQDQLGSDIDSIYVNTASNSTINGNAGADIISNSGEATSSSIFGGLGNDFIFQFQARQSAIKGGNGNDDFNIGRIADSLIQGNGEEDQIGGDVDTIEISIAERSKVNGNAGDDNITIRGATTSSSIFGGSGQDQIDVTTEIQSSTVAGDDGNDVINIASATSISSSTINGNGGNDTIQIGTVGTAGYIGSFNNSEIRGGDGNDIITGPGSGVILTNLSLFGDSGADTIFGGAGLDTITGGTGADDITSGPGPDDFITANGDSVQSLGAWGNLTGGGDVQATSSIAFGTQIDVIRAFGGGAGGDQLDLAVAGAATAVGTTAAAGTIGNLFLRGDYVGTTFTGNAGGADTLVLVTTGTDQTLAANLGNTSTVLLGAGGTFNAAQNII